MKSRNVENLKIFIFRGGMKAGCFNPLGPVKDPIFQIFILKTDRD